MLTLFKLLITPIAKVSQATRTAKCGLINWIGFLTLLSALTAAQPGPIAHGQTQAVIPVPPSLPELIPDRPANTSLKHLSQADQAAIILRNALLAAVWGRPVHCLVRHEIDLLGRQLRGTGKYARGNVGEMKLVLTLVAGDHQNRLEQISDGRFLRTVHRIDGREEGSHVDLNRVSTYLGRFTEQDKADPLVALHLSIGGQNEKLRAIVQQYRWTSVKAGKFQQPAHDDEVDVWWLEGVRDMSPTAAVLRGTARIDGLLTTADDAQLAPRQIKIAVGRGGAVPYWLYFVEETRAPNSKQDGYPLVLRIDYHDPTPAEMPARMFTSDEFISSSGTDFDETDTYLPPPRFP